MVPGLKMKQSPDAPEERGDNRSHRQHDLLLAQQEGYQHLTGGERAEGHI